LRKQPISPRGYLLTFVTWLLITVPLLANADVSDIHCFETSSTINGAQLLPHLYHHSDSSGAIKIPELNAGHELTQTIRGFQFTLLGSSDESVVLDTIHPDQWFLFCLRNPSKQRHDLVLTLAPATLSEIDFYPQKSGLPSFQTGSTKSISTRDVPNAGYGFKISLAPEEQQRFYLRVNASDNPFYRRTDITKNPFFLATVWDRDSYDIDNNRSENTFGIIVGVLIALVIYNLLLFISTRQLTSLLYIASISSVFIVLSSLNGRLVEFTPASYPLVSSLVIVIFYPLSLILATLFLKEFIKLKKYPTLNFVGNVIIALSILILIASYSYKRAIFTQIWDMVAIFITLYFGVFVSIYTFIKDRLIVAKYVLITLAPLILSLVDRALFGFGVTDQYYIPFKIVTAAGFALILFSYLMGLIAYREKQAVQRSALKHLNLSNTLKSNYNKQLEEELEQKTADIRLMNTDLEQKANKLLQLDESKSRFFANISHEFRTPLTLIEGPLTMLLQQKNFSEKRTIEGVLRNSNSLKNLIDQVLLLSELDEKSLDLKVSEINVVQVVSEFSAQFSSLAEQKKIRLTCDADRSIINAYVDHEKLQTIINNLLSNAIKFTEESGGITIEVSSTVPSGESTKEYSRDEYVKIVVSDTGHGIPQSELPFVFDRYFQSDSSELSKSGIGTGIGLALVKELVELHAGEVSVESICEQQNDEVPSGTSFCVTLPLGRAHLSDNEIVQNVTLEKQLPNTTIPLSAYELHSPNVLVSSKESQATVLIVDDNDDMRRYIQNLLEDDYHVLTAQDGLLAEEAMKKQAPDLIVTDLMMPNRNGLEFVEAIKSKPEFANIPVIMLTARAGLHDRLKGLMAAVDDYLVKPFNGLELKIRVHNLLNKQAQFSAFYQNQGSPPDDDSRIENSNSTETYIDKIKTIVDERLNEADFGVSELAKALHVSEATLRRRLAEHVSFTPAAFIRHCRLEQARKLLWRGKVRSVAELAHAVGFSKPSYFSRLYQRTFNTEIDLEKT